MSVHNTKTIIFKAILVLGILCFSPCNFGILMAQDGTVATDPDPAFNQAMGERNDNIDQVMKIAQYFVALGMLFMTIRTAINVFMGRGGSKEQLIAWAVATIASYFVLDVIIAYYKTNWQIIK